MPVPEAGQGGVQQWLKQSASLTLIEVLGNK